MNQHWDFGSAVPACKVAGLDKAEGKRRLVYAKQDRDQNAAFPAVVGLQVHPLPIDRLRRPHNDNAAYRVDLTLDHTIPSLTARDAGVPPYAPALRFKECNDQFHYLFVGTGVAYEHV